MCNHANSYHLSGCTARSRNTSLIASSNERNLRALLIIPWSFDTLGLQTGRPHIYFFNQPRPVFSKFLWTWLRFQNTRCLIICQGFIAASPTYVSILAIVRTVCLPLPVTWLHIAVHPVKFPQREPYVTGQATPTNFALSMFAYSLFLGMSRPISNHLILKQVRQDTGTASSLLTFFNFLCAAIAMELISLDWSSKPMAIAVMGLVGSTIPFAAILAMKREK